MRSWAAVAGPMLGPVLGAVLLGGCLQPATIEAEDAWVRLPAVPGRPASGYFTLRGGRAPAMLVAVSADLAVRTEMHATVRTDGGAMTMRPLAAVPLPANGEVRFAPGARHLMLFGVSPSLKPGGSTVLTFTFADGSRLQRKAWAIAAGDPAPE